MRYLGIDYGTKRIGLALSDERGEVAFPDQVIPSDQHAFSIIKEICAKQKIGGLVIGHSLAYDRGDNPIQKTAEKFAAKLSAETHLLVSWQDETLSTQAARREPTGELAKKDAQTDARAAAIILQTYLDQV